jgi:hypothetical protein
MPIFDGSALNSENSADFQGPAVICLVRQTSTFEKDAQRQVTPTATLAADTRFC